MANFYPTTNVGNVALLKFYKTNRVFIRKWHFPDYTRLEQFSGYEGKMKMIFRDAELHHIADGSIVRPEPNPDPAVPRPPFLDVHQEIYDEANSILYSMIFRTLTLENGGLVDAGGIAENKGRELWFKLTCDNYKITRDGIPLLKLRFYDQLAFRQTKDTSLEMWANQVRMAAATLSTNGNRIPEDEQTLVFRKGLQLFQLVEQDVVLVLFEPNSAYRSSPRINPEYQRNDQSL